MAYWKTDVKNRILRDLNHNEEKIEYFKNQNFVQIKKDCLSKGLLFEDPMFPPTSRNLFYSKPLPKGVKWMRPSEICALNYAPRLPKFVVNKAEADDLDQGYLGNCWFIAGCIAITYMDNLFKKVVPLEQYFAKDYAGIFHFRFWIYGIWFDVIVDDYLPVYSNGTLMFCQNKEEPNEFWAALLEKAFAKVCGSYENMEGGFTSDALIDMSGGIEESINLTEKRSTKKKNEIWQILVQSRKKRSMAGAYLDADPYVHEKKLDNGLVQGHAYIITKTATINVRSREVYLIRLKNPWGNEVEWNGAWSDHSTEWKYVSETDKVKLQVVHKNNGEFWMRLDDFYENFNSIQFCHLTPDSLSDELLKLKHNKYISWKMVSYHGEWVPYKSAGGSGNNNNNIFWTNPQFLLKLEDVDKDDNEDMATVIVSLMQKYTREKRMENYGKLCEDFIQFRIYRVLDIADLQKSIKSGQKLLGHQLERMGNSGDYINKREVVARFRVPPGYYLIIPSLFESNRPGEFLLRIFTEELIDEQHAHILNENNVVINSRLTNDTRAEHSSTQSLASVFKPSFDNNLKKKAYGDALTSLNNDFSEDNIKKRLLTRDDMTRKSKKECKIM